MTSRKKKAVNLIGSGAISIAVGFIMYFTETTPAVVDVVLPIVAFIASSFGFDFLLPADK